MKLVLFVAQPGAGKGSASQLLREQHPNTYVHISVGDMVRDAVAKGGNLASKLQPFVSKNQFCPDDLINEVVVTRLQQPDVKAKTVLLDGYPRLSTQSKLLAASFPVHAVVVLTCPDDVSVQRMKNRRIDPSTNKIYNLNSSMPDEDEEPDVFARLQARPFDDDEEAVRGRLAVFHKSAADVLAPFAGKIYSINAVAPMYRVAEHAASAIAHADSNGSSSSSSNAPRGMGYFRSTDGTWNVAPLEDGHGGLGGDGSSSSSSSAAGGAAAAAAPAVISLAAGMSPASGEPGFDHVTVRVQVPELAAPPVDICLVIDCSGSMSNEAFKQDESGDGVVASGLSRLDLVKHAAKTVIHTLGDADRCSIIAFDATTSCVLPLTTMNGSGKSAAIQALKDVRWNSETNIAAAITAAFDSLRADTKKKSNRIRSALLLSDGVPNPRPPEGELGVLKAYQEAHPDARSIILSMIGFGYELNPELMCDCAAAGNGSFAYIPDAAPLGSIMVSAVAALRTCVNTGARLHIMPKGGAKFGNPAGGKATSSPLVDHSVPHKVQDSGVIAVDIGPLYAGQHRDICLRVAASADPASSGNSDHHLFDALLELPSPVREEPVRVKLSCTRGMLDGNARIGAEGDAHNSLCSSFHSIIDAMDSFVDKRKQASAMHQALDDHLAELQSKAPSEIIAALLEDVRGRSLKSHNEKARYERWGSSYLRMLFRSHQLCVCSSMLDPGLQIYGGDKFRQLLDAGGKTFKTLPMETTLNEHGRANNSSTGGASSIVNNDSDDDYWGGGCFAGSCTVQLVSEDDSKCNNKKISDVRRGDRLRMADGSAASVQLLVELRKARGDLVEFQDSGLLLTPNHPVRRVRSDSNWTRPRAMPGTKKNCRAPAVFNVVFEEKPTCGLLVNGVECITYHHAVEELEHPFYSSDKIMERLRSAEGFEQGNVVVHSASLK